MKLMFGVAQFVNIDRAGHADEFRAWLSETFPERDGKHVGELRLDTDTGKLDAQVWLLHEGRPYWDHDQDGAARDVIPVDTDAHPLPDFIRENMVPA